MQEEVNVQFQRSLEEIHELIVVELGRQAVFKRDLGTCAWNLDAT